jgi:glycosyltransferase involved in cell wall biosynthesis
MLVKDLVRRKNALAKSVWIELIERTNIERAAAIHVTSTAEATELHEFSFALPRVIEVPNGIGDEGHTHDQNPSLPPAIEALLRSDRPIVLCLGRVHWKKGLDRLITAVRDVPDAQLLIVGNDEENYTGTLVSLAHDSGVQDRVSFAGPIFGAAKAALYRRVSMLALASYSENFGNVVLEAMAEGCPVVVTREVGASSVVAAAGGGIVAAGGPSEFAAAMRDMLASSSVRMDMGERGRKWVVERYSWDAVAGQMLNVYEQVIANHRRAMQLMPGPPLR